MWVKEILLVFIAVAEVFKDTVSIFCYEIHLKYCQDTDDKSTIYFSNGIRTSYPGFEQPQKFNLFVEYFLSNPF